MAISRPESIGAGSNTQTITVTAGDTYDLGPYVATIVTLAGGTLVDENIGEFEPLHVDGQDNVLVAVGGEFLSFGPIVDGTVAGGIIFDAAGPQPIELGGPGSFSLGMVLYGVNNLTAASFM